MRQLRQLVKNLAQEVEIKEQKVQLPMQIHRGGVDYVASINEVHDKNEDEALQEHPAPAVERDD